MAPVKPASTTQRTLLSPAIVVAAVFALTLWLLSIKGEIQQILQLLRQQRVNTTHLQPPARANALTAAVPAEEQYNGMFHYQCEAPCELAASFFQGPPEGQIKQIFVKHLKGHPQPLRVVDIGMNAGYFSLLAASYGAQVTALDPQPGCIGLMKKALQSPKNAHIKHLIRVLNVGVGHTGKIHTNHHQCEGGFKGNSRGTVESDIAVVPISTFWTLDDTEHAVTLIKIDTEGAEVPILEGLLRYAEQKLVGAIVVEVAPKWWADRGADTDRGVAVLNALKRISNNTYLLGDPTPFGFASELVSLDGVSPPVVQHFDIAELIQDRATKNAGCNLYFKLL